MTRYSKKKNSGANLVPVPWSDYPGYVIKEKKVCILLYRECIIQNKIIKQLLGSGKSSNKFIFCNVFLFQVRGNLDVGRGNENICIHIKCWNSVRLLSGHTMLNTDTVFKKVIDLTNRGSWETLLNNSLTICKLKIDCSNT